jgi:hypothetical protein
MDETAWGKLRGMVEMGYQCPAVEILLCGMKTDKCPDRCSRFGAWMDGQDFD